MKYSSEIIKQDPEMKISSADKKIIWKRSPDLFFILFSAMMDEGYISTKRNRIDEYQTAKILYKVFDVLPKTHDKKEYTFNSFYQNIKSSGSLQKESKSNIYLKTKICKFLKALEPEDLSLFK